MVCVSSRASPGGTPPLVPRDLSGRFSHIIDPGTGEPVATSTASVSVIAGEAMIVDGWATALMAAGERGPAMAEQNGLDALFLFRDGLGGIERISTHRFAAHIA